MADATMERIEKQLEGNSLALSAVAEILQKMDARYSKEEETAIAKEEAASEAAERNALVKEIATEVAGILKADAGLDVDGTKVRSAAKTGKLPTNADDAEKPVTPTTKIEDQQATIQAMQKGDDEEESEDYPIEEKKGGMKYKAEDDDNMQKAIQSESENRLRKMGFKEENGLQAPKRLGSLGVDGTTPISKSANKSGDVVEQLSEMSYKQLRDIQVDIEMGKTDGIPKELL